MSEPGPQDRTPVLGFRRTVRLMARERQATARERPIPGRSLAPKVAAAAFVAAVMLTGGCGSQDATLTTTSGSAGSSSDRTLTTTTPGGTVTGSVDAQLKSLVEVAVADLVGRLHVDAPSITVVSAQPMTWPDGGLGCPRPGMAYPQTQVDGALIELSAGGTVYRYHSGGSRGPFLCENAGP